MEKRYEHNKMTDRAVIGSILLIILAFIVLFLFISSLSYSESPVFKNKLIGESTLEHVNNDNYAVKDQYTYNVLVNKKGANIPVECHKDNTKIIWTTADEKPHILIEGKYRMPNTWNYTLYISKYSILYTK